LRPSGHLDKDMLFASTVLQEWPWHYIRARGVTLALKLYFFLTFFVISSSSGTFTTLSSHLLGFPFCRQTLFFSFYYCLNSVAWMWLLLYRKRHFLTECFQTLNLCREELQSLLSWRIEVQDSRLHPMLEKRSPTDEECPERSAVIGCNWPQTLGQVTTAGRWTSRATETSTFYFIYVFI